MKTMMTAAPRAADEDGRAIRRAMPKPRDAGGKVAALTTTTTIDGAIAAVKTMIIAVHGASAVGTVIPKAMQKQLVAVGMSVKPTGHGVATTTTMTGEVPALEGKAVGLGIRAGMPKRRVADGTTLIMVPADGMETREVIPKHPVADGITPITGRAAGLATQKDIRAPRSEGGTRSRDEEAVEGAISAEH